MAFDRNKYLGEYQKENLQRIYLKLSRIHESDLIEHLDRQPNKQGYIKDLIRADMEKNES